MLPIDRRSLLGWGMLAATAAILPDPLRAKDVAEWPSVRTLVQSYVRTGKVPAALAMIGKGTDPAETIASGTLAKASTVAVDQDTLWRLYSMTKPVTGMAAMMLVGDGQIRLDQPVADFIPEFAEMRVLTDPNHSLDSVPARGRLTIRHILTHSGGLGYTIVNTGPIRRLYMENGLIPGVVSRYQKYDRERLVPTPPLDEFARRLGKMPLLFEPGTRWSYGVGLDLMGRIIEIASGKPFDTFIKERLFAPLGMDSTFFQVPRSERRRLSTNHFVSGGLVIPIDNQARSIYYDKPAFPFGGAGLAGSARDYDRFLTMLLNNGHLGGVDIMHPDMVALGTSNLLPPEVTTQGTPVAGQGFGAGGRVGLGAQAGSYGWAGAAGTIGYIDRRRNLRAACYAQFMPADAYGLQTEFPAAVARDRPQE